MSTAIPDLWPTDIKSFVWAPVAILRTQANLLEKKTGGLIRAIVDSESSDDSEIHKLELEAPALKYRVELATVTHRKNLVYPVNVFSIAFESEDGPQEEPIVDKTEDAFIQTISMILKSDFTKSLVQSLVASSNQSTDF